MNTRTNELLEAIYKELHSINKNINAPPPDNRIWEPDNTCIPFLLENSRIGTSSVSIFRFRLPSNYKGVIASITTSRSVAEAKVNHRFGLTKVRNQASINVGDILKNTGGLPQAEEIFASSDNPGFAPIGTGPVTRPCRVLLDEGESYEFWYSGGVVDFGVSLFGWIYPTKPKSL